MNSILNREDNFALQNRINQLEPTAKALWGTMNPAQMLSHCQAPIDLVFGKLSLKTNLMFRIMGKIFKNKILNSPRFKKNSPTVKEFLRNDDDINFEEAKATLLESLTHFAEHGEKAIKDNKHPFFGTLTNEELGSLQYKHLDHHLNQFGV
jgi:hypothetical protein